MLHLLAGAVPPELTWRRLDATDVEWPPTLMLVVAGAGYLWGARRVGRSSPQDPWHGRRTVAFFGGLAVTFVAVESVFGVYDTTVFWDHMIQHLLLVMVAAALFAMGAPVELLDRGTSGRLHDLVHRALASRPAEVVGHPVTGFALYAVLIPFTHLTSFYNLALEHGAVQDAEHLLFLVVGYLFWRPVVAIEPSRHRLNPGLRLAYLALAVPVDTFCGLALTTASHELFPAYTRLHRTWGPTLVEDLHIGGTIMWVGGDTLMLIAMVPVAIRWMHDEELKALEIDRQLDEQRQAARATGAGDGPGG